MKKDDLKKKTKKYFLKKSAALLFTLALAVGFTLSGADENEEGPEEQGEDETENE